VADIVSKADASKLAKTTTTKTDPLAQMKLTASINKAPKPANHVNVRERGLSNELKSEFAADQKAKKEGKKDDKESKSDDSKVAPIAEEAPKS